ncbi:MAG TPA: 50S ribosomal protein L4 [Flammeovirgaceae bacterium]|nr:50S ribosomal protein L4 [Flammeovirgaceae bacterium]
MNVAVVKNNGEDTGRKVKLSKEIFGIEPNDHAIYLDVKQYLANQRQGTHKAKERSEVRGSTRKIKRQKGTGTARAGSIKSPLFRGGGRVFGPKPRNYSFKLNKKVKVLARKSALSYKAQEKAIAVLEDFTFEAPRTKDYLAMLNSLKLEDKKTLLVLPQSDRNVILSGRNIKNTRITTADTLNTYDVLHADTLVLVESSVEKIEQNLLKK